MAPQEHHHGHDHSHAVSADADRTKLMMTLGLLGGFLVAEVVAGILSNSLALLSDAAHMLTDTASITFAIVAINLSARAAFGTYTFGLKRAGILAASINGLTLVGLGLYLGYQGILRLITPPDVEGIVVLIVGAVGIVVNLAATWTLAKANRSSLNVEGAFQHVLTDLYAFVGTTVAGVVILVTGFMPADGLAALLVSAIMIKSGVGLVRASTRVFLEAAPRGLHPGEVHTALLAEPGVTAVNDLHVWEVTSDFPAMSAHVIASHDEETGALRRRIADLLRERFGIDHTTLQVEHKESMLSAATREAQGCRPT